MTNNIERKYGVAFVPNRLEVDGKAELSDFPKNVLFGSYININGKDSMATSLYVPDFASYTYNEEERRLIYTNIYGKENVLTIIRGKNGWSGQKNVRGEQVLFACGAIWDGFFSHLTMNGLSKGEGCKYEPTDVPNPKKV